MMMITIPARLFLSAIISSRANNNINFFIQKTFKNIKLQHENRKRHIINSFDRHPWFIIKNNGHKLHHHWVRWTVGSCYSMSTHQNPSNSSQKIVDQLLKSNRIDTITKTSNKIYTIPNLLCMARICITPLMGYLIIQNNFEYALAICTISSITDFLDGWIARNFNSVSKLGSILDPLADKLLVVTLTLTLTYVQMIPIWLTALIFTRDLLIILGGFWMRFHSLKSPITFKKYFDISTFSSERFRPTMISKLNTGLQLSLVLITLALPLFTEFFQQHDLLLPGLQWITGLTTLWSGLLYIKRL